MYGFFNRITEINRYNGGSCNSNVRVAIGGMAGALAKTSLSMATHAFLTGAAAGFYGGSTARILSGTGITPATIAQDTILGGTSGLVAFGAASAYQQATALKPSTTNLQERANLVVELSEAEGCEGGTITLNYQASSGAELTSTPGRTTTILGRYESDTGAIIKELDLPKSTDFSGNPGGFNLLNTPDNLYAELGPDGYWNAYNKPFLDAAISRGDEFIILNPLKNTCHKFSNYLEFLPLVLTIFRYSRLVKENVQEVDYERYYFCGAVL